MAGKGVVRSIKNYAKGFSDVQIKVREATSNDSWGPSGSLMNEIAQLTFNEHDFIEIMDMLDRRLNDKGKNWRHVFKALLVLDYCIRVGSENVVLYAKENIYVVRTLKEFQHVDETGKDVGYNVRQKAKDITSLLLDEQRLKEERRSRHHMQDRMANVGDYMSDVLHKGRGDPDGVGVYKNPGYLDEDRDLKRAIEESKRLAEQESRQRGEGTDEDLQRAIRESEQEAREQERKKREALDRENLNQLFGQQSFQPFPAQQDSSSLFNPYSQQQQQQFAQPTGMSFAEPIHQQYNPYQGYNGLPLQAQMTGFQAPQMTGFQSPQMTGFQTNQTNPFGTLNQTSLPSTTNSLMIQNRDNGMDTFGNTGNLRTPYGTGFASTLVPQTSDSQSSSFSQPFNPQPSRNPFGSTQSPQQQPQQSQKSMFEMMQQQTGMQQPYSSQQPSFF